MSAIAIGLGLTGCSSPAERGCLEIPDPMPMGLDDLISARAMRAEQVATVCVHRAAYELARSEEAVSTVARPSSRCKTEIDAAIAMAGTRSAADAPNAEEYAERMLAHIERKPQ